VAVILVGAVAPVVVAAAEAAVAIS